MSEVHGRLVLNTNDKSLFSLLAEIEEDEGLEALDEALESLELNLPESEDGDCLIEEASLENGYIVWAVFGDQWPGVIEQLMQCDNIDLWAKLWDEVGIDYYFASCRMEKFKKIITPESTPSENNDAEMTSISAEWQSLQPADVVELF